MRILYAGYRKWAMDALDYLWGFYDSVDEGVVIEAVNNQDDLLYLLNETEAQYDAVVLAGWSWIIPDEVCERFPILGIHPSDLPEYAGGSPIQHQVLAGLRETRCCLFRITPKLDGGGVLGRAPLNLEGSMRDIFMSLKGATVDLVKDLVDYFQKHGRLPPEEQQEHRNKPLRRLKPSDSELTQEIFMSKSARELYDFIRCREDPYPNVFIKDKTGTLRIKLVEFEGPDGG